MGIVSPLELPKALLEQTAGNPVHRFTRLIVDDGVGLQQLVHHAALSYIELEEPLFGNAVYLDQGIISDFVAMDRMILAERALVDPAVGKDEKILGYVACASKILALFEKDFGVNYRNSQLGHRFGNPRYCLEPTGWINLKRRCC